MYRVFSFIFLLALPVKSWCLDYDFSVGLGSQYGGLGTQFSVNNDKSKYFLALGFPIVSIGVKTLLSDNTRHSWGVNAGKLFGILSSDSNFAAITYNYHFSGFNNSGWELGTGISYYKTGEYTAIFSDEPEPQKEGFGLLFNLGYTF